MSFENLPGDRDDELPSINLNPLPGDRDYQDTDGEGADEGGEMPPRCRFGADRRCYGEDCVCCEVYLEQRNDIRFGSEPEEPDWEDHGDWEDDEDDEEYEDTEPDESMDGDFDTGMASAGLGTDEDYDHYSADEGGEW